MRGSCRFGGRAALLYKYNFWGFIKWLISNLVSLRLLGRTTTCRISAKRTRLNSASVRWHWLASRAVRSATSTRKIQLSSRRHSTCADSRSPAHGSAPTSSRSRMSRWRRISSSTANSSRPWARSSATSQSRARAFRASSTRLFSVISRTTRKSSGRRSLKASTSSAQSPRRLA